MEQAGFLARSWPVQDWTVRSRTGRKAGRSELQYSARKNVSPVRSFTEAPGRTEKTQSPPPPFLVVTATGSLRVNHHVSELPLSFLPLIPVCCILLQLVAIAVMRALQSIWSSQTWHRPQPWHQFMWVLRLHELKSCHDASCGSRCFPCD